MITELKYNEKLAGRIFMTGDIHGSVSRMHEIRSFCEYNRTSLNDLMILLGDVGINFSGKPLDEYHKDELSKSKITFVAIRGNHEIRPQNVLSYKRIWNDMVHGLVYVEEAYPNILWLEDGKGYEIFGKTFLAIGGAYSVDKGARLTWAKIHGKNCWFPDEQLSQEEMNEILPAVSGKHYDFVITHTCPVSWQPRDLFLDGIDQTTVDTSTEEFLERVKDSITFDRWYFGHFHEDRSSGDHEMLFNKIIQI